NGAIAELLEITGSRHMRLEEDADRRRRVDEGAADALQQSVAFDCEPAFTVEDGSGTAASAPTAGGSCWCAEGDRASHADRHFIPLLTGKRKGNFIQRGVRTLQLVSKLVVPRLGQSLNTIARAFRREAQGAMGKVKEMRLAQRVLVERQDDEIALCRHCADRLPGRVPVLRNRRTCQSRGTEQQRPA